MHRTSVNTIPQYGSPRRAGLISEVADRDHPPGGLVDRPQISTSSRGPSSYGLFQSRLMPSPAGRKVPVRDLLAWGKRMRGGGLEPTGLLRRRIAERSRRLKRFEH